MPLPENILLEMKVKIEEGEKAIKDIEDIVEDLRASGIDASRQEDELRSAKEILRKAKSVYELQRKRIS